MPDAIRLVRRNPTPDEYQMLRAAVGWPHVERTVVKTGLQGTLYAICAERAGDVVGCGRIVGDGGIYLYLQDVIVRPEFQRQGIGRRIMDDLMAYVARTAGTNTFVGLMAATGVVPFYERYGFRPRPPDRPGMFLMWPA